MKSAAAPHLKEGPRGGRVSIERAKAKGAMQNEKKRAGLASIHPSLRGRILGAAPQETPHVAAPSPRATRPRTRERSSGQSRSQPRQALVAVPSSSPPAGAAVQGHCACPFGLRRAQASSSSSPRARPPTYPHRLAPRRRWVGRRDGCARGVRGNVGGLAPAGEVAAVR